MTTTVPRRLKLTGTLALVYSGLAFAVAHALVKLMNHVPAHEVTFLRAVIAFIVTFAATRAAGIPPWGKNKPMLLLRGLFGTGALLLYFYTLQTMPLASAVTIQYLHPMITVLMAGLIYKERASALQWLFFFLSMAGVFLVRGFDPRVTALDLGLGVLSAIFSSCAYTLIRGLRHEDHALTVMLYLPFVSLLVLGPYTLTHWVPLTPFEWAVAFAIGISSQVAQYFVTRAYQLEPAAKISNLTYLGIVYAMVIGIAFFGEAIEPLSFVGILVIVASATLSAKFK